MIYAIQETVATTDAAALLVAVAVWGLASFIGIGLYLWYGWALSRLFPRLCAEGWKGWVPFLNEATLLSLGGKPGWAVVFALIPIAQLYWLYLKIVAVHRINEWCGRGAGFTVLAIVLPPLWATLLTAGGMPNPDRDRLAALQLGAERPPAPASGAPNYLAAPSVPAVPVPPVPPGSSSSGQSSAPVAAGNAHSRFAPPPPVPPVSPAPPVQPAPPVSPTAATPVPPVLSVPPAAAPSDQVSRVREHQECVRPEPIPIALPTPPRTPVAPQTGEMDQTVIVSRTEEEDDFDETVVVVRNRDSRRILVLDDGSRFELTSPTVVIGRNPESATGEQRLTVPDKTRTLSKTHARLVFRDGEATLTDLQSTNGVMIVSDDGVETLLEPGESVVVSGRFVLGEVGMLVEVEPDS